MKVRNLAILASLATLVHIQSGCVALLAPRFQKVTIKSTTPEARINIEGDSVGKSIVTHRCDKNKIFIGGSITKEGYKTRNFCFEVTKLMPIAGLSFVDAGVGLAALGLTGGTLSTPTVLLYGGYILYYDLRSPKLRKFKKDQVVPALIPLEKRTAKEKYMFVNTTAVDAKEKDIRVVIHPNLAEYYKKVNAHVAATGSKKKMAKEEDFKIGNTIFTTGLNHTLKKMNYIDTTSEVFPNLGNTLYLNATIKEITYHAITSKLGRYSSSATNNPNRALAVELKIEWEVMDYYKTKIRTLETKKRSDVFVYSIKGSSSKREQCIHDVIEDNLEYSLLDVRKDLVEQGLLGIAAHTDEHLALIELDKPKTEMPKKLEELYKSSVTVKVDDGYGSGAIISVDGYIVTNYHVISNSKKIEIIFNDSVKMEATIVRKNEEADLALLKVDKNNLSPFYLSSETDPDIGGDVWAIGTGKEISLGTGISKGIISGVRKTNGLTMLQTDASLNNGNNGGALVNREGAIIGIISGKISRDQTEGIGFALLANQAMAKLGLKYKQ